VPRREECVCFASPVRPRGGAARTQKLGSQSVFSSLVKEAPSKRKTGRQLREGVEGGVQCSGEVKTDRQTAVGGRSDY
jgi:hypothetical protein